MNKASQKNLALFFTINVSLEKWREIGNLDRELRPYKYLSKLFKKIYFFTYGGKKDLQFESEFQKHSIDSVKIIPKKASYLPSVLYALLIPFLYWRELREIDIYKTNQMAASPPAILAKILFRKKLVVRCGYEWLSFLEKQKSTFKRIIVYFLEYIAYNLADKIIVTSKRDRKFIEKKFNISPLKIEVIPNYIDTELFKPLNIPKEARRICFVGGLSPQKNPLNLLRAVDGLDVKLVLFGKEEMDGRVKLMAKKIKKAKIEFKGNIPNTQLPKELNKSQLFILPSLYEGNPKALLEAMSCGIPCIGTRVEGVEEIIRHKENGYLCDTSAKSIRKAIIEVLEDASLQKKIGKGARQTIIEKFGLWENLIREIKVYQSL